MEHPPDTHSARTPVGTTATPGLTLDLATPIPCESGGLWGTVQTAQGVRIGDERLAQPAGTHLG